MSLSKNLLNSTNGSKNVTLLLHMMNSYFAKKTVEEDRDSLVTALRILSKDVKEHGRNTNTVDLNDKQQVSKSWEMGGHH